MIVKIWVILLCGITVLTAGKLVDTVFKKQKNTLTRFFETILKGSIFLFIYLQIVSFFLPLKITVLLPVWIAELLFLLYKKPADYFNLAKRKLLSTEQLPFAIFLLLCSVFCFYPTINSDSVMYHIPTTEFFHDYKLIPGLANINEQVGVNSATFLLNAPFCRIAGASQGIYPMNAVWIIAFSWWLLQLPLFRKNMATQLGLAMLFFFCFRSWLININSPSNDVLFGILTLYVVLFCYNIYLQNRKPSTTEWAFLFILSAWGITVKVNTAPLLLIVTCYGIHIKIWKHFPVLTRTSALVFLIAVLWCARNVILSGYLLFLFIKMPFYTPDFTIPETQVLLEKYFLANGPRVFESGLPPFHAMHFLDWFPYWITSQFGQNFSFGFVSLIITILSTPVIIAYAIKRKVKAPVFITWCISMLTVLLWLFTTPEYRFAYSWLVASWTFLLVVLPQTTQAKPLSLTKALRIRIFFLLLLTAYFTRFIISFYSPRATIAWLYQSPKSLFHIQWKCNLSVRSVKVAGITLHPAIVDSMCLGNSPWLWRYPMTGLEARGEKIEDGFRYSSGAKLIKGVFKEQLENTEQYPAFHQQ